MLSARAARLSHVCPARGTWVPAGAVPLRRVMPAPSLWHTCNCIWVILGCCQGWVLSTSHTRTSCCYFGADGPPPLLLLPLLTPGGGPGAAAAMGAGRGGSPCHRPLWTLSHKAAMLVEGGTCVGCPGGMGSSGTGSSGTPPSAIGQALSTATHSFPGHRVGRGRQRVASLACRA